MKRKIIEKSKLQTFIEELTKEYEIIAPVKRDGQVSYGRISSGKEICLDFLNSKKPPKEIFLPQTETLFTYRINNNDVRIEEPETKKSNILLLGVRPCDARGISLIDNFFSSGEYKDAYFIEKKKKAIIAGLACTHPQETCFCTSVGGGPFSKVGMDLFLQDINDRYVLETVTQHGEKLIENILWLKDAGKADVEETVNLSRKAENAIRSKVAIKDVPQKLDGMFDDPIWDRLHQKCVGCGICTYFCPTCSCFDILDEGLNERKRVRIWDSCQFPLFTLEGSGHNPRPSGKERLRQRIMHKFNYQVKNFGEIFCVGCGRCVRECPVNLDIREVIGEISTNWKESL